MRLTGMDWGFPLWLGGGRLSRVDEEMGSSKISKNDLALVIEQKFEYMAYIYINEYIVLWELEEYLIIFKAEKLQF